MSVAVAAVVGLPKSPCVCPVLGPPLLPSPPSPRINPHSNKRTAGGSQEAGSTANEKRRQRAQLSRNSTAAFLSRCGSRRRQVHILVFPDTPLSHKHMVDECVCVCVCCRRGALA